MRKFRAVFFILVILAAISCTLSDHVIHYECRVFVPAGAEPSTPLPLVMMLHGCTQTAEDFASGTRMDRIAEEEKFIVVYPQQGRNENINRCWEWFLRRNQERDRGEPQALVAVIRNVQQKYPVDQNRIYVAGISAGAAMANVLAALYPDVFAAVGSVAGLEFGAAESIAESIPAMKNGGPDPDRQAKAVNRAMGERARPMAVIAIQGTADKIVNPVNTDQVLIQWARANELARGGPGGYLAPPRTESRLATGGQYPFMHSVYVDGKGTAWAEKWIIYGLGHAWPGGNPANSYTDPNGPDASRIIWEFFKSHPKQG